MKTLISQSEKTAPSHYPLLSGRIPTIFTILVIILLTATPVFAQGSDDPTPPQEPVKIIFIHHSTGENWLTNDYGNLGRTLGENNYFVSDTNYGWGPEAIGDRTDILNWQEWFRGPNTPQIMTAVYQESGQNSQYTRTMADPGGENSIVMFKSCFPNSEMHGSPDDPPQTGDGSLNVGAAKAIYIDLLAYFKTRPDKLFIVITAPPLSDPTYAANARAFNEWLVNRWLVDAQYPYPNVAVWDFYNVLTGQNHHSRYNNGSIEHTYSAGKNTLVYPSGDDHANPQGSQKATAEFVPMLNIFYHRWKATAPAERPSSSEGVEATPAAAAEPAEAEPIAPAQPAEAAPIPQGSSTQAPPPSLGLIDDFEAGNPAGSDGWQAYKDDNPGTLILCEKQPVSGVQGSKMAMHVQFNLETQDGWASCDLPYTVPLDWRSFSGVSFMLKAQTAALPFSVLVHTGSQDAKQAYAHRFTSLPASSDEWMQVVIPMAEFKRVDWEENPGSPLIPQSVISLAFVADPASDGKHTAEFWVDNLRLSAPGGPAPAEQAAPAEPVEAAPAEPVEATPVEAAPAQGVQAGQGSQPEPPQAPATEPKKKSRSLPFCPGSLGAAFLVAATGFWFSRNKGGRAAP